MNSADHKKLDDVISRSMFTPFDWEKHNCCTFAGDVVQALGGVDHLGPYRDVKNLRGAIRAVKPFGGLSGAVSKAMGEHIPPLFAGYGDIVLIPNTQGVGDSLGVCVGSSVLVPGLNGLVRVPLSEAAQAWRVPVVNAL